MRWFIPASVLKQSVARRHKAVGLAMGAYTVFLDVALGVGSPVLGLIALVRSGAGFVLSMLTVLGTAVIATSLMIADRQQQYH